MAEFGEVNTAETLIRVELFDVNQFRKGVSAPSDVTIGTTPTVQALNFSATAELLSLSFPTPINMDTTIDPTIILDFALSAGETNGDTLDVTLDYNAHASPDAGNGPDKASTQVLGQTTVTTANGLAINDPYSVICPLDAGDATNPLSGVNKINFEFHLTNITGVAEANFLGGCIQYTSKYKKGRTSMTNYIISDNTAIPQGVALTPATLQEMADDEQTKIDTIDAQTTRMATQRAVCVALKAEFLAQKVLAEA